MWQVRGEFLTCGRCRALYCPEDPPYWCSLHLCRPCSGRIERRLVREVRAYWVIQVIGTACCLALAGGVAWLLVRLLGPAQ